MPVLGPGIPGSFQITPATQQIVFEESSFSIKCWLYPAGTIVAVEADGGTQQASRILSEEIDKTTHTIRLAPRAYTLDLNTEQAVLGDPQTVFLDPL